MLIHLLRHGIAEDLRPGLRDDDRALTDEGRERLRAAGSSWRELIARPEQIWSSPLRRAQETAAVFAKAVRFDGEVRTVAGLRPEDDPRHAIELLEGELLRRTASVVLVGHEPSLGLLFGALLLGRTGPAIPLRKGMLATVETIGAASLQAQVRSVLGQRAAAKLAR